MSSKKGGKPPPAGKGKAAGKPAVKKPPKAIAALREAMEEKERLEREEAERLKQEEERLAREAEERAKEEERKKEEAKKQSERDKKLAASKPNAAQEAKRLAALERLNINLPAREGAPVKKPYYGKKKPQKKPPSGEVTPSEATPEPPVVEPEANEDSKSPEPEVLDDWELADIDALPAPVGVTKTESTDKKDEEEKPKEGCSADAPANDESSKEDEEEPEEDGDIVEIVHARIAKRRAAAIAAKSLDNLRSPVICVLGHVDTGKTKMLDTIRRTNVQINEAGGITQQIGATRVPIEAIKERCKRVRGFEPASVKIPGFLIIDTPGHESFANLRSRGSSLCDLAILVVDIMHGLEPQTKESIKLLRKRGTPFVIALNKVDRLYGYESSPQKDIYQHFKSQSSNVQLEFEDRYNKIIAEFAELGMNVALANQGKDPKEYVAMVPTSAFMGDGIGNILAYLVQYAETHIADRLAFIDDIDATVMEVRVLPGLGTTIDVILLNGTLRTNDTIVLTGIDGPIKTQIRDLLMPAPLREIRVKTEFEHHNSIKGAQGVKILAKNLENVVAGLPMFVVQKKDEADVLAKDAENQLKNALMAIVKKPLGVYVQASTLGSLEALLEFLKGEKIPYSGVNIGPVHKKDVQKAAAMLEHNIEYACILAFDVPVDKEVQQFADKEGVRIFCANIIYHLEDSFKNYREELRLKRRRDNEHLAIFPCKLQIMPQNVFNARNPIVCGVTIMSGQLKRGTPICVPSKDNIFLGAVASIEKNHESVELAKAGDEVCIKIENTTGDAPKLYGRHFTADDVLYSRLNRESIDVCKSYFRDDLTRDDWKLVIEIKKLLSIL